MQDLPHIVDAGTGFSINGKGYVVCGQQAGSNHLNHVIEYDPITNEWNYLDPFPGGARYGIFSFVLDGMAYVGCGNSGSASGPFHADVWRYDPVQNDWEQVASYPGTACYQTSGFSIDGKGYVLGGAFGVPGGQKVELYQYDPALDSWSQKSDAPIQCVYANVIALDNYAILVGGPFDPNSTFRYNADFDQWYQFPDYPGGSGYSGIGFTIDGRVFAGCGFTSNNYYSDLWELKEIPLGINENDFDVGLYPNPVIDHLTISSNGENQLITIYDLEGRAMEVLAPQTNLNRIDLSYLSSGLYVAVIEDNNGQTSRHKIIKK